MMRLLDPYEAPVIIEVRRASRIRHLEPVHALHVEWLDFSDDTGFAQTMLEGLSLVRDLRVITWIADTQDTNGSMSVASQTFLHELHASGSGSQSTLRAVITVEARKLLAFLSNQWWQREVAGVGHYLVESVRELDDAVTLAHQIASDPARPSLHR